MLDLVDHGEKFVYSSGHAKMKQMRKIACDFSLCKASWEGGGGGEQDSKRLERPGPRFRYGVLS